MGEEDRDGFHVLPLRPRREMKVCKTCGRLLPLGQFPRHFKSRDGHTEDCLACYSKKMRAAQARRRANRTPKPPVVREELPEGMKRCKRCGRVLPVTEYGPHRNAYDHLFPLCNDCRREVGRESYEKACRKKGIEPKPRKI